MEKATLLIKLPLLTLFLLVSSASSSAQANAAGRKVGGRTEVKDVKNNEEVQELGRYCVREYNKVLQEKQGGGGLLSFSEVVKAETQVVSGFKYYLKISAASSGGARRIYDAVVVVKPWAADSRELLDFAPSPDSDHPSKQFLDILV
ncbi:PREDICTED: cysteine proteinase inhibitor B-like [Ipomoea nil]|uniref:cysteine proteinase inhibitor B-like n=1 Tax=Ipomoea nil TaxID=35883 RepID=UPI000901F975|nr:PREDICTED: cysteine proteinase inhibitor B-like [Ipomoea nil]